MSMTNRDMNVWVDREISLSYGDLAMGIDTRAKQELMVAAMDSTTAIESINQAEKALRRWRKAAKSLETIARYAAGQGVE